MKFGQYHFECIFKEDALLPEYKGGTFRGSFGHALKQAACPLKKEYCTDCLLISHCIYIIVFEGQKSDKRLGDPSPTPFHPYVIVPTTGSRTHYREGDIFDFRLLLFGQANDYLPYFILAFDSISLIGSGKKRFSKNGPQSHFKVMKVSVNGGEIYTAGTPKKLGGTFTEDVTKILALQSQPCAVAKVRVHIHTPLRLKYENKLIADLPFHILVRAALRRISSLCKIFGDGEPDLDYRGLVARAREVQMMDSSLSWFDWKRYSNRQDRAMLMGGIIGHATYRGELGEFLPLLRFCEKTHLGKQTTFGLGRIEVREESR